MAATEKAAAPVVPAEPNISQPSNFASRKAARLALEATTGGSQPAQRRGLRAGIDAQNDFTVRYVQN